MSAKLDIEGYREQGYALCRGLIDADCVARWDRRARDLMEARVPRPQRLMVVRDVMVARGAVQPKTPLHAVNKIFSFEEDPVLMEYAADPRVLERVQALIGPDVMSITTNVINKPPGVDGRHALHQDLLYFALRPAHKIVGTWTALGPSTRENGCLCVIPGSHRGPLRKHADPDWEYVNRYFFAAEGADLDARVHVEMAPGDTLFFHPLLLHGSGRNRSEGFRRAITVHYARADCERRGVDGPQASAYRRLG